MSAWIAYPLTFAWVVGAYAAFMWLFWPRPSPGDPPLYRGEKPPID